LYSSAGIDVTQGTPVDVMKDTAKDYAYDQYIDNFETQNRIYSNMLQAKFQRAAGRQKAVGSLLDYGTRFALRG
jgi:hypothetical protein